jgi:hypothetical protein
MIAVQIKRTPAPASIGKETTMRKMTLFDEPVPIPLDRVLNKPSTTFFAAGIVNPFGPTLTCLSLRGEVPSDDVLPLIRVMLNPFSQTAEIVGEVGPGPNGDPLEWIRGSFSLYEGGCPTLLLPSALVPPGTASALYSELVDKRPDARGVWDRVRNHYGNPWDRIREEVASSLGSLTSTPQESETNRKDLPLAEAESLELSQLLLAEDHTKEEIAAFAYAWNGAIGQAPTLEAMDFGRYVLYFVHLTSSCIVPDH